MAEGVVLWRQIIDRKCNTAGEARHPGVRVRLWGRWGALGAEREPANVSATLAGAATGRIREG